MRGFHTVWFVFGKPVGPDRAVEIGLIDRIGAGSNVRAAGLAYAAELLAAGAVARPVGAMPRRAFDPQASAAIRAHLAQTARGLVSPQAAVDAVEAACRVDLPGGLVEERRLFTAIMQTPQRERLIHAFFAERKVARLPELDGIAPRGVAQAGVVGGGTMGAWSATALLLGACLLPWLNVMSALRMARPRHHRPQPWRRRDTRQTKRRSARHPAGEPFAGRCRL